MVALKNEFVVVGLDSSALKLGQALVPGPAPEVELAHEADLAVAVVAVVAVADLAVAVVAAAALVPVVEAENGLGFEKRYLDADVSGLGVVVVTAAGAGAGAGAGVGAVAGIEAVAVSGAEEDVSGPVVVTGGIHEIGADPALAFDAVDIVGRVAAEGSNTADWSVGMDHILHTADNIADIVVDTTALELAQQQ